MDDLARFRCLNSGCPDHGKRAAGNLTVTSRSGPGKARRMLRCRTCRARFSERKGAVPCGARLAPERVEFAGGEAMVKAGGETLLSSQSRACSLLFHPQILRESALYFLQGDDSDPYKLVNALNTGY